MKWFRWEYDIKEMNNHLWAFYYYVKRNGGMGYRIGSKVIIKTRK